MSVSAQTMEISTGWKAIKASEITIDGAALTTTVPDLSRWMDATVPGTVLTTLLNNKLVPDPYYGLNNESIPDISEAGRDYYTYWFYTQFSTLGMTDEKQVWLNFRGINYLADIYLNGNLLTTKKHEGMFLRGRYNITRYLNKEGNNLLAILVEPPLNPGKPNGGQGGDGMIGKDVTMQFTTGWDWIQPVRDRNTGIWDKVYVEITGSVDLSNTFARARVPGVRLPGELQNPAFVSFIVEVNNPTPYVQEGTVTVSFAAQFKKRKVTLEPNSTTTVVFDEIKQPNPKLWWPNGIGTQSLYAAAVSFEDTKGSISDREDITFGFREFGSYFDTTTGSRVFTVNGQKVFLKGANWIASDALLRLSNERYNAEVKMHADMNINIIRVWGGSITERPEFYEACDKNGIMVWQDLWITGDCNGRWNDATKADSQEIRRKYPENHDLFVASVTDQVKMLRNHASLVIWCGGNEFPPESGLNDRVQKVIAENDGTRYYLDESTSADLVTNTIGKTADGPYSVQEPIWFFTQKWYPFNPEIGSVGLPNIDNMKLIMDEKDIVMPSGDSVNKVWKYHKYLGYGNLIDRFGKVSDVNDFFMKAQIIGYDQYRAIQEGHNNHMWEWYTGMMIWKSQNPWTALRGQFYDWFLDPNATYFGYRHGAASVHGQFNPADSTIWFINSTPKTKTGLRLEASLTDPWGKILWTRTEETELEPNALLKKWKVDLSKATEAVSFLRIKTVYTTTGVPIDDNTYWITSDREDYSPLFKLPAANVNAVVLKTIKNKFLVEFSNSGSTVAFFVRVKVMRSSDSMVVSPVFMEDNYFTLLPGEKKILTLDISSLAVENRNLPLSLEFEGVNLKPLRMQL